MLKLKLLQPDTEFWYIEITEAGMESSVEHPSNARTPIEVTPSRIVTLARLEQSKNAQSPIDFTVSGMVMLVRLEQP